MLAEESVHVEIGDAVEEGDPLATLVPQEAYLRVLQAEAQFRQARSTMGISEGQSAETLNPVKLDPHQFQNLATMPQSYSILEKMRGLLGRWQAETGDSVAAHPTPDRQELHVPNSGKIQRGELPGEDRESTKMNTPGPITISS